LAAAASAFLVMAVMAPGAGAAPADDVNQFRFTRRSNDASELTFTAPGLGDPMRLRAGSGTVSDECLINFGWLPLGAYDVSAHDTDLEGDIAGYAWELSDGQCYDGTFRTDLLIHSEMSADGGQDPTWEPNVWTDDNPGDYTSFGCIKVSYEDVLALEQAYERVEDAGYRAELLVE
jgi:hypothetical protein